MDVHSTLIWAHNQPPFSGLVTRSQYPAFLVKCTPPIRVSAKQRSPTDPSKQTNKATILNYHIYIYIYIQLVHKDI